VGLTPAGEFAVPDDPGVVGRWDGGALPGSGTGTVSLAGHVSWGGVPGTLHDLARARAGDQAWLLDGRGSGVGYVVEAVRTHLKSELPVRDIFRADVAERLVLITCGGRFDPVAGRHDSNVVVYLRRG
jgi:sortase (surface protein transpeptidase)